MATHLSGWAGSSGWAGARDRARKAGAPRDFARTTLKPRHRPLVFALAEAMFAHALGPTRERLDVFVDEFDRFISFASRTLRFGLLAMLAIVRFAPLVVLRRFATFETLDREDRVRVVERMAASRFIGLAVVLTAYKAIFSLIFFEHDEELAALGYSSERRRYKRALHLLGTTAPREAAE
ncbi:MAG: hypothetical protein WBY94_16840 [Polyangiaceae bacterium]